jgi:hypothetical protein
MMTGRAYPGNRIFHQKPLFPEGKRGLKKRNIK